MIGVLASEPFIAAFGDELKATAGREGKPVSFVTLSADGTPLPGAERERLHCIFLDRDLRFDEKRYAAYLDLVLAAPNLKWISFHTSGVGQQPHVAELGARGVIVTSSAGANAEPVALTAFAGVLMLARGFGGHIHNQARREWKPLHGKTMPDDLRGQTLLLIGVGAVGALLAGYARAVGLKVIGIRRSPMKSGEPVDEMHPPSMLPELLPRADWIVVACPLTRETRGLIGASSLRRVKKGARLINIARGEIVDETALLDALQSGQLGGAALDALSQEPLPKDSPLWDMDNVIISPHSAFASTGNEKRCARLFIDNFRRWLRGEPMLNVQDFAAAQAAGPGS